MQVPRRLTLCSLSLEETLKFFQHSKLRAEFANSLHSRAFAELCVLQSVEYAEFFSFVLL